MSEPTNIELHVPDESCDHEGRPGTGRLRTCLDLHCIRRRGRLISKGIAGAVKVYNEGVCATCDQPIDPGVEFHPCIPPKHIRCHIHNCCNVACPATPEEHARAGAFAFALMRLAQTR